MNGNLGILVPNVTTVPGAIEPRQDRGGRAGKLEGTVGEFERALEQASQKPGLSQVRDPLKFSAHAMQRLNERKISMDPATMVRVNEALDKAAAKGLEDTLVLTSDAAYIISVKNRTVITAMDRNSMTGNVFTNIDGAVIV